MKRFGLISLVLTLGILLLTMSASATPFPNTYYWTLVHSETYDWYLNTDGTTATEIQDGTVIAGTINSGALIKVEVKETVWVPGDGTPFSGPITLGDGTVASWPDTIYMWHVTNECYATDFITSYHVDRKGFQAVDWTLGTPGYWSFDQSGPWFSWTAPTGSGIIHGDDDTFKVRVNYAVAYDPRWSYVHADVDVQGVYSGANNWVTSGPVPEPGTLLLLGSGLLGIAGYAKFRLNRKKK